jgi:hypothetical protein
VLSIAATPACSVRPAKAEETFALQFLDLVRHGRTDDAFARLDPTIADAKGRSQLQSIASLLGPREPLRVDQVSAGIFTNVKTGVRTASFVLQLQYPSSRLERCCSWDCAGDCRLERPKMICRIKMARRTASLGEEPPPPETVGLPSGRRAAGRQAAAGRPKSSNSRGSAAMAITMRLR